MNNVDLIIKYLSGVMNPEETAQFKNKLVSNGELKDQFDEVSIAYNLIRDQLQKRDEEAFKNKLLEAMGAPAERRRPLVRFKPVWYYLIPLAGCLAILMVIYLSGKPADKVFSRYFHPENDPVVLAFNQANRGKAEPGILHYQLGHFHESMEIMSGLLEQDQENRVTLLYYLLSSIELDLQDDAIAKVRAMEPGMNQVEQALQWYTALALIKSGHTEEAADFLEPLTQQQGPYQSDAWQLKKMLLK